MRYFGIVSIALAAAPAAAQDDANGWTLSATGGTSLYAGVDDRGFAAVGITREFERGYVGIDFSGERGGQVATETATLSAGRSFAAVALDGYASLGRRRIEASPPPPGARAIAMGGEGSTFALGASLSSQLALSDDLYLLPRIAFAYDRVESERVLTTPAGLSRTIASEEAGITGSLGAALEKSVERHRIGAEVHFNTTSNSAAARVGSGRIRSDRVFTSPGESDGWASFGGYVRLAISSVAHLDLAASRTVGLEGPQATSLVAGVGFRM
jgi:hypothetical protein